MPDMNDFHAFKSTSGGDRGGSSGDGCLKPIVFFTIVIIILCLVRNHRQLCGSRSDTNGLDRRGL